MGALTPGVSTLDICYSICRNGNMTPKFIKRLRTRKPERERSKEVSKHEEMVLIWNRLCLNGTISHE